MDYDRERETGRFTLQGKKETMVCGKLNNNIEFYIAIPIIDDVGHLTITNDVALLDNNVILNIERCKIFSRYLIGFELYRRNQLSTVRINK